MQHWDKESFPFCSAPSAAHLVAFNFIVRIYVLCHFYSPQSSTSSRAAPEKKIAVYGKIPGELLIPCIFILLTAPL